MPEKKYELTATANKQKAKNWEGEKSGFKNIEKDM